MGMMIHRAMARLNGGAPEKPKKEEDREVVTEETKHEVDNKQKTTRK